MSTRVIELNESNFDDEVLGASTPVLVEFWAEWSRSCQAMAPYMNSLAQEQGPAVKVAKVDVDGSPGLANRHGVRAVPTLLVFHQGAVHGQIVGVASSAQVRELLKPLAPVNQV